MTLPQAPRHVVGPDGMPALGRFAGKADSIDWSGLAAPYRRSAWWRRFHHKRWHYVSMARGDLFCAVAIVDLGWTSTAFAYAFDRRERRLVASFSQDGLAGIGARLADSVGGRSTFRFLSHWIAIRAAADNAYTLTLRCGAFTIDACFGGDAPLLLAVGEVEGGSVHATQKSAGLALTGEVQAGGRRYSLEGGVASIDYSNGLLARDTAWRWACAHGLRVGFNLQAGYFGGNENALWLHGAIIPLGAAAFAFDSADPMAPWHVATEDGLLELHFTPEGMRRENKHLVVAASQYVQPIGTFDGWVRPCAGAPAVPITALPGVTEQHKSRW